MPQSSVNIPRNLIVTPAQTATKNNGDCYREDHHCRNQRRTDQKEKQQQRVNYTAVSKALFEAAIPPIDGCTLHIQAWDLMQPVISYFTATDPAEFKITLSALHRVATLIFFYVHITVWTLCNNVSLSVSFRDSIGWTALEVAMKLVAA